MILNVSRGGSKAVSHLSPASFSLLGESKVFNYSKLLLTKGSLLATMQVLDS